MENVNNRRFCIWKNHYLINKQILIKFISDPKDSYKAKYQLLINKRESTDLKHFNDSKAFIECSNKLDGILI